MSLRLNSSRLWCVVAALMTGWCSAVSQGQPITVETVLVSNPGNANDPARPGYGGVAYEYEISIHEVNVSQWCAMLNAVARSGNSVMYTTNMTSFISRTSGPDGFVYAPIGDGRLPMRFVTYVLAQRFCNWMNNGQPVGSDDALTSAGAYSSPGGPRVSNWQWALPTWSEWHKAAFGNVGNSYTAYPTASNTPPNPAIPPGDANSANIANAVRALTPGGAYPQSRSYWGTFDQGGNASEFVEKESSGRRVSVGGSFSASLSTMASNGSFTTWSTDTSGANLGNGFRLVRNVNRLTSGGCCLPHFAGCVVAESRSACETIGGAFAGEGTTCLGQPCAVPQGACCLPTGVCQIMPQAECINSINRGRYCGHGTQCEGCCRPVSEIIFVRPGAPAGGDGWSWDSAKGNLQEALDLATTYSGYVREIWIASGTLRPEISVHGNRLSYFRVSAPVWIRGGFAGVETDPAARSPLTPPTILDGDFDGNDASGIYSDNAAHVILNDGLPIDLERVTIRGGGTGPSGGTDIGALKCTQGLTLRSCTLVGNIASGSGTAIVAGTLVMEDCIVEGSGDMSVVATDCSLARCTFSNLSGGSVSGGRLRNIVSCDFTRSGNAKYALRGTSGGDALIDACTFTGGHGGLFMQPLDATQPSWTQKVTIRNSTFRGLSQAATLKYADVSGCVIQDNASTTNDSMWIIAGGTVTGCLFSGNVGRHGAALSVREDASCMIIDSSVFSNNIAISGGALHSSSCTELRNGTMFSGNVADLGNAIRIAGGELQGEASFGPTDWISNELGVLVPGRADTASVMTLSGGYRAGLATSSSVASIAFRVSRSGSTPVCSSVVAPSAIDLGDTLITLRPLPGFTFAAGDRFELIRAGEILGTVRGIDAENLPDGLMLEVERSSTSLAAVVRSTSQSVAFDYVASGSVRGSPLGSVCADVDGDGFNDLVCIHAGAAPTTDPGMIVVYRNLGMDGSGSWAGFSGTGVQAATPADPVAIAGGFLNGDGVEDVVVTCKTSATLSVFHGIGGGGGSLSFSPIAVVAPNFAVTGSLTASMSTGRGPSEVRAVAGTAVNAPAGTAPGSALSVSDSTSRAPDSLVIQVIVQAGMQPSRFSFAWRRTPGGFTWASVSVLAPRFTGTELVLAPHIDLPDSFETWSFDSPARTTDAGESQVYSIRLYGASSPRGAVEIDNILYVEPASGASAMFNFNTLTPRYPTHVAVEPDPGSHASNMLVTWQPTLPTSLAAGIDLFANDGVGLFAPLTVVNSEFGILIEAAALWQDADADGVADLFFPSRSSTSPLLLNLWRGVEEAQGPGNFEFAASFEPLATTGMPIISSIRAGHFNGSEELGVVYNGRSRPACSQTHGMRFVAPMSEIFTAAPSPSFDAIDLDDDGLDDVLCASSTVPGRLQAARSLFAQETPVFGPASTIGTAGDVRWVRAADVTNDGLADAIMLESSRTESGQWYASAYINRHPPRPAPCQSDFNADGGVDGSDVGAFMLAWETGAEAADINADGGIDGDDIAEFFASWEAGC